jgi:hypothetical protein
MPTQPRSPRSAQPSPLGAGASEIGDIDSGRENDSPSAADRGETSQTSSGAGPDDRSWTGILRDAATARISNEKRRATEGIGGVARILRESTDRLQQDGQTTVANYARQTADQLERLSRRLDTQELDDVLRNAQRFARSQPLVFVAAAFGVGLCAARFFKSSNDERSGVRDWESRGGTFYAPPMRNTYSGAGGYTGPTT